MGPLLGTPLRNLILRALARKMRFRWEKTILIWMETVVDGFKKSHFARIRAQNEISLEKKTIWIWMETVVECKMTQNETI